MPPTSGLATASLVLGIVSFVTCGLTAIPAVICGHLALGRIKAGALGGYGVAVAGMVMGYLMMAAVGIAILAGLTLPVLTEVRDRAAQTGAMSQLKVIGAGCEAYAADHQGRFPPALADLVPRYLPDGKMLEARWPEPGPFEYFGGARSDPPEKVIAATKRSSRGRRVVLHADGSAAIETPKR